MVTRIRHIEATPDRVWDVLADGWLYPLWVVGATAMQDVDDTWPDAGARLDHLSGSWPLALKQRTTVLECDPGRRLVLEASSRHLGASRIATSLTPSRDGVDVRLERHLVRGIRKIVPEPVKRPLLNAWADDCLLRLSFLAERRR